MRFEYRAAMLRRRPLFVLSIVLISFFGAPAGAKAANRGVRVAILDFEAAGTKTALSDLGPGLQAMLTTDLSQIKQIDIVERRKLSALRTEINFTKSRWADPKTALKVGSLAGATHVLFGTYTVVGTRLRIDCRLVALSGGKVESSVAVEGELDAFFEVAKDLGRKLLEAVSVAPAPKERAAFAKVQTSDLEALQKFSQGLILFDQSKYDDAIAALEAATKQDRTFDLAKTTLDDYRSMIEETTAKAESIRLAERVQRGQATDEKTRKLQEYAIALMRKANAKLPPKEKLAALWLFVSRAKDVSLDGAEGRVIFNTAQFTYFQEALKAWPLAPILPPVLSDFRWSLDFTVKSIDEDVKIIAAHWDDYANSKRTDTQRLESFIASLGLDTKGRGALLDSVQKAYDKLPPDSKDIALLLMRARLHRMNLDLETSTKLLLESKRRPGIDARALDEVAGELAVNQSVLEAQQKLPAGKLRDELLIFSLARDPDAKGRPIDVADLARTITDPSRLEETLGTFRKKFSAGSDDKGFIFVDGVALRVLGTASRNLSSGPRPSDFYRTDQLRYEGPASARFARLEVVLMNPGPPVEAFEASVRVTVNSSAPQDPKVPARTCLIFKMQNVDLPAFTDLASGIRKDVPANVKAACVSSQSAVEIVQGGVNSRNLAWISPLQILETVPMNQGKQPAVMKVRSAGKSVHVEVGEVILDHMFAEEGAGFWGIMFDGPVSTRVSDLKVTTR